MKAKHQVMVALLFLAATLVINYLGANGTFNGKSQQDVSDAYLTLLTPEPRAFFIWGVIYAGVILSLLYLLKNHNRPWAEQATNRIFVPFVVSCLLNIGFIVTFSYEWLAVSALFTLGLAICAAVLVEQMNVGRTEPLTLPAIAFGLYSGWTLIATVLNVAIWLVKIDWDRFGLTAETWAVIMLIVATLLAALVTLCLANAIVPLPAAWAFLNIGLLHGNPNGMVEASSTLQWLAYIGTVLMLALAGYMFVHNGNAVLPVTEKKLNAEI